MSIEQKKDESFRDHLATAETSGKRIWVYPAKPKGKLYRWRSIVAAFLLAFLFFAPFIKVGGQPLLLFNIIERQFHIFGLTFWPQDFHLFVLFAITMVVFIILFTAIFGRLFCGWICPQTVFLEMVFRRIEYWIEGGPARQRQLSARPWDMGKTFKRLLKHGIFFGLSFFIGNTFLAYIVGVDDLIKIITDPPSQHVTGLVAMLIFSFLFYGVFSWFREQACTLVCPYGRLQSVLIDSNSIIVGYDYNRGEPRRKIVRGEERSEVGDCVECNACVAVCPTGIDIRNGTQLECVNCTACIDACNNTMRKVGFDEGLIRYTSESRIASKTGFQITGRIIIYTIVFSILSILLSYLLITRTDVETTILRAPGELYYEGEGGTIRNLYSVKLVNKTQDDIPIQFKLVAPQSGTISVIGGNIIVPAQGLSESALFVDIPRDKLFSSSSLVKIEVLDGDEVVEEITTSFLGPQRMNAP
ncbi:MAG: cytochrome c oxidase accessory protein CcoG [Candidatus Zixiibacteriota bacterium]